MKHTLLFCFLLGTVAAFAQTPVDISTARSQSVGSTVTVKGIVTNGAELGATRYMQDNTAGIVLYHNSLLAGVEAGDSVIATGSLASFNNLLEINVTNVTILSKENELPEPALVSLGSGFTEANEGKLVRVENVAFVSSGIFAGNANTNISDGINSQQVRITSGTGIEGTSIPGNNVGIVGVMGQFYANYQLIPRSLHDIITDNGPRIISLIEQENITTSGFDVHFSTATAGDTRIYYGRSPILELGPIVNSTQGLEHSATITGLNPADVIFIKVASYNAGGDSSVSAVLRMATRSSSSGKTTVYFTTPTDTARAYGPKAQWLDDAIDDTLISYINRATQTIDVAIYNLNNQGLSDMTAALNNAHSRGVRVRVVYDGGTNNMGISSLNSAIGKIASPQGSNYTIMHNKFVVFDVNSSDPEKAIVWTGSTNLTDEQINKDANNVVIIHDQSLAKAYTLEFEEMFGSPAATPNPSLAKFGQYKTDNTPHQFVIGGIPMELSFSPSDGSNNRLVKTVNSADHDFYCAVMVFTKSDVATALRNKGFDIPGFVIVNDTGSTGAGTQFLKLQESMGNKVKIYVPSGILHHKFIVVDPNQQGSDPTVLTGSHNWSNSADTKNDENMLIIHDADIASMYYQEFAGVYQASNGTLPCMADFSVIQEMLPDGRVKLTLSNRSGFGPNQFNWNLSNGKTATGPVVTDTIATPGNYTFKMVASSASCSDSAEYDLDIAPTVGIAPSWTLSGLEVFPNPASDKVYLHFSNNSEALQIRWMDLQGKEISSSSMHLPKGEQFTELNVPNVTNGIYLLQISAGNQQLTRKVQVTR